MKARPVARVETRAPLLLQLQLLLLALVLPAAACKDSSGPTGPDVRVELLAEVSEHVIVPMYAELAATCGALPAAVDDLCAAPDEASLDAAREAWHDCRTAWSLTDAFRFGPVAELRIDSGLDFWPVREEDIESVLVGTETIDLSMLGSTRKGLPVVEYLLFAGADPLARFAVDSRGCQYVTLLAADVAERTAALRDAWPLDHFAQYDRVQDALTELVNGAIDSIRRMEGTKLAGPLGRRDGGAPQPAKVESRYSTASLRDLRANLAGLRAVYEADHDGRGTTSLHTLVQPIAPDLDEDLLAQMEACDQALAAIPEPLAEAVTADAAAVEAAFTCMKELLRLWSADLAGLLGVTPTFGDADGD